MAIMAVTANIHGVCLQPMDGGIIQVAGTSLGKIKFPFKGLGFNQYCCPSTFCAGRKLISSS